MQESGELQSMCSQGTERDLGTEQQPQNHTSRGSWLSQKKPLLAQRNTNSKLIPKMKRENKRRKEGRKEENCASPKSNTYLGTSWKPKEDNKAKYAWSRSSEAKWSSKLTGEPLGTSKEERLKSMLETFNCQWDRVHEEQVSRNKSIGSLHGSEASVQLSSVQPLSHVRLFAAPWTAARQASLMHGHNKEWWHKDTLVHRFLLGKIGYDAERSKMQEVIYLIYENYDWIIKLFQHQTASVFPKPDTTGDRWGLIFFPLLSCPNESPGRLDKNHLRVFYNQ